MTKKEYAMNLFRQGYNCSQSVLCAFCEELGLDTETAARLASSFGGGMGRMREVCGAFSGMLMVLGLRAGYSDPKSFKQKAAHYKRVQELAEMFKEQNGGSIICRELLGLGGSRFSSVPSKRTEEYYKKRPCINIIGNAAEIIEKYCFTD
ncbi:MAG TPA: C-GCAxxG-C-C family protein [Candidatus Monoglobus merdigallinarum]|uniref:C-GCAxxG-C-C family protein n=1 Tax=Candidatus Monoglobus merdigallinarum TaxID=2838698 RepID=A0A9D1PR29_9FIRM|nr:C-GCAxxG-C-C family protein [Candidatus Monoglobus merdigallinarum]